MTKLLSNVREYPKLLSMLGSVLLAYVLYQIGAFDTLPDFFHGYGYITAFIGGLLFTVGFTTPFGIALLVSVSDDVNPVLGALVAGSGAALMDFSIFEFAKLSLHEEIERLKRVRVMEWIKSKIFHPSLSEKIRLYMLWCIAGILIASPLPDEFGVPMLSGVSSIEGKKLLLFCFAFNTIGIFLLIGASRLF